MAASSEYTALSALLPGKVHLPGTTDYVTSQSSYFAAFENEVSPACFIQPTNVTDIVTIIKHVQSASSATSEGAILLAVRSGGHTAWAGSANIAGGITIDLSNLETNAVVVDEQTNIATIGAGARWGDVYRTLASKDLGVVGGRVSNVGVGGLALGGEYFK